MQRRAYIVRGIVQGVGFRPFVYRLALACRLNGQVRNEAGAVSIEVEGDCRALDRFGERLIADAPPLAAIDKICCTKIPYRGETGFTIAESAPGTAGEVCVSPDVALCADCRRELFDPADRRYRYPFLNCTNCGPRLTIIRGAPYDRAQTTMASFAMCEACRHEYEDPADRRYHAQPTCCPRCGPQLQLWTSDRRQLQVDDPLQAFAEALLAGHVGALKGLGGYHLACDAGQDGAVATLRLRKQRDDKPFALLVASIEQASQWCEVGPAERALLLSPARPIVLLRKRRGADGPHVADGVAPGNPYWGVMLPYTPLHCLLMDAVEGRPLVMTSGNRAHEPIASTEDEAFEKLAGIADVLLTHDRPIHVRCDDSVTRIVAERESPLRRSRGYAPRPVELPTRCERPVLAVGGQLKATFALAQQNQAVISHHLGDLDDWQAYQAFERDIALYEALFQIRPRLLVHDLHPDYASSEYARRREEREGIDTLAVQHHHAHLAACMAEHQLQGDVLGVIFDGTGLGTDGAIWGGEFLVGGYGVVRRAAHLRYVPLPGGDQAIRQPWRSAAAHLHDAGCSAERLAPSAGEAKLLRQMLARRVQCPLTSSAGRLFDAVAALAGVRASVTYEGQAAMELEWLAADIPNAGSYPFEIEMPAADSQPMQVDTRPLIRAVAADVSRGAAGRLIARRFHSTLVELIATVCGQIRDAGGPRRVVLSGGVFQNALLAPETATRLQAAGFDLYQHRVVPPGDGGICLGQLAVAAFQTSTAETAQQPATLRVSRGNFVASS